VKRDPCEDVFGVQVCGNNPELLGKTVEVILVEIFLFDVILRC